MNRLPNIKLFVGGIFAGRSWIVFFAPLAWLGLLMLPTVPVVPELDMSWAGALPYFAARGFHFGKGIIFTYGPLGHLTGYAYTGYLSTERTAWEFVIKTVFVLLYCGVLRSLSIIKGVALALCIVFLLGNYDEAYMFAIISAGLVLLGPVCTRLPVAAGIGLFLAALCLVKFDYFLAGCLTVALTQTYCLLCRRWAFAGILGGSFVAGLSIFWLLANQRLSDFPAYVANSWQIAAAYGTAMFIPTGNAMLVWIAFAASLLLTLRLAFCVADAKDKIRTIVGSLFLLALTFILWRHAFTRGQNHFYKFFALFPAIALAADSLRGQTVRATTASRVVAILLLLSTLFGIGAYDKAVIPASCKDSLKKLRHAWHFVVDYKNFARARDVGLQNARKQYALKTIKATVNREAIDVLGYRQGIALLNDLNYIPRPVFQGYTAYTPSLIQMNTGYYQSAKSPQFVLARLETIDERFPTLDDSGVLVQLLSRYEPVVAEKNWQLWRAIRDPEVEKPLLTSAISTRFNENVTLPQSRFTWAEVIIHETWLGKLVGFLYKTSPLFLELQNEAGDSVKYRIVPSMSGSGFLLNPQLQTNEDLVAAARGAPLHHFASMKVVLANSGRKYFSQEVGVRFYAISSLDRLPLNLEN